MVPRQFSQLKGLLLVLIIGILNSLEGKWFNAGGGVTTHTQSQPNIVKNYFSPFQLHDNVQAMHKCFKQCRSMFTTYTKPFHDNAHVKSQNSKHEYNYTYLKNH